MGAHSKNNNDDHQAGGHQSDETVDHGGGVAETKIMPTTAAAGGSGGDRRIDSIAGLRDDLADLLPGPEGVDHLVVACGGVMETLSRVMETLGVIMEHYRVVGVAQDEGIIRDHAGAAREMARECEEDVDGALRAYEEALGPVLAWVDESGRVVGNVGETIISVR